MPTERQPVRQTQRNPQVSVPGEGGGQGPCKTFLSGTDLCDKHSLSSQTGFLDEEQVRSLPDIDACCWDLGLPLQLDLT